jgi:uncharacterized protein (TIGR02569 family)
VSDPHVPGPDVLRAFGLAVAPVRLAGGQGESWRAGDVVLKPVPDPAAAGWVADVLERVVEDGFRVARPVRHAGGGWVAGGWAAHRWVAGEPGPVGRWAELLGAARAFHHAVRAEPQPPFLAHRDDRWARGDRAAWEEASPDVLPQVARVAARLRALTRPAAEPPQLVHGDLSGNVLFAEGLAPAVIDVSPYWRPAAYAEAVAVADGLLWWGEGAGLLAGAGRAGDPALVARGVLFRLLELDEHLRTVRAGAPAVTDALAPYHRAADVLAAAAR